MTVHMLEPEDVRAQIRAWLETADVPTLPDDYDQRFAALQDWHRALYRAGWVGLQWPLAYGGRGLSAAHQMVVSEELARIGAPQPAGAIGLDVVGPTILTYGTDEQRSRMLPTMLAGDKIWCQGFSEPDAGSDLASLRTRGEIRGDTIVVTGQKVWTSWASHADWCAVLVRTDPAAPKHRGISYLLVDMRSPGLTVRPLIQITGDAEFCEVFLDEVAVPRQNLIGQLNGGWPLVMNTLGHERASYAIRRRLENELVFNKVVAELIGAGSVLDDPEVYQRLGELFIRLRSFAAVTRLTSQRLVGGDVPSPWDSVDKLLLAMTEQHLYGVALDLLGPFRMCGSSRHRGLDAREIIKGYLYGRAASVYGGTAQIQRSLIAERLLGLPRGAR
jgi:alkylation response protein AidB-like acyl-CoA dehydrogenase